MSESTTRTQVLDTSAGEFPLHEYRLRQDGREWTVLHTGAVLTRADEARVIGERVDRLPYGVALWPSAIALRPRGRHPRGGLLRAERPGAGRRHGAAGHRRRVARGRVVQTDRDELAMLPLQAQRRAERRRGRSSTAWRTGRTGTTPGATSGSSARTSSTARRCTPSSAGSSESNLAREGRVLLSDPFRGVSLRLLEALEGTAGGSP